MADGLPETVPAPRGSVPRGRSAPQPRVTWRRAPTSGTIPGSNVPRPKAPKFDPTFRIPNRAPEYVARKPAPKPVRKPRASVKPVRKLPKRKQGELVRKVAGRVGKSLAHWTPKLFVLARYYNPLVRILGEALGATERNADRARAMELQQLDALAARALRRSEPQRGRVAVSRPVVRPSQSQQVAPRSRPISPPQRAPIPQILSPVRTSPEGVATPKNSPKSPSAPVRRPSPTPRGSPRFQFWPSPLLSPQLAPQVAYDYLTAVRKPGVASPPGQAARPGQPGQRRQDKCKCPKPRKPKAPRAGRGFFIVSRAGKETRKYWKTGKYHTKEYKDASNPSRSFGGRSR